MEKGDIKAHLGLDSSKQSMSVSQELNSLLYTGLVPNQPFIYRGVEKPMLITLQAVII